MPSTVRVTVHVLTDSMFTPETRVPASSLFGYRTSLRRRSFTSSERCALWPPTYGKLTVNERAIWGCGHPGHDDAQLTGIRTNTLARLRGTLEHVPWGLCCQQACTPVCLRHGVSDMEFGSTQTGDLAPEPRARYS